MRIVTIAMCLAACSGDASTTTAASATTFQDLRVTYQVVRTNVLVEYRHPRSHPEGTLEVTYFAASAHHDGARLCSGSMPVTAKSYFDDSRSTDRIMMVVNVDDCPSVVGADARVTFTPSAATEPKLEEWLPPSAIVKVK